MKKLAKILWMIVGVVFLFVILVSTCAKRSSDIQEPKDEKQWSDMSYEEKDSLLNQLLKDKKFLFSSELESQLKEAIKKECVNPKTVRFTISPSDWQISLKLI